MFDAIFQPAHLILILTVVLLVLGPKRLPAAGRALGQGLREFKGSISGDEGEEQ
jgi:sec-independent protein translocase protein TatA